MSFSPFDDYSDIREMTAKRKVMPFTYIGLTSDNIHETLKNDFVKSLNNCQKSERKSFLSRVYKGSTGDMIAAFLKEETISKEDREKLKKLLDDMTDRANEMTHAGLKSEKVIADLIADEFGDLVAGYPAFLKRSVKAFLRN